MKCQVNKISKSITMAGGGNETFTSLARRIRNGSIGMTFVAGSGLSATTTINIEISYNDGTSYVTLTDSSDTDVTDTLAASGTTTFSLADIPVGAIIRPKFVTSATGDITVTTYC